MLLWILQHQQKLFENVPSNQQTESSVVNKERNICQIFDVALPACNGKKTVLDKDT